MVSKPAKKTEIQQHKPWIFRDTTDFVESNKNHDEEFGEFTHRISVACPLSSAPMDLGDPLGAKGVAAPKSHPSARYGARYGARCGIRIAFRTPGMEVKLWLIVFSHLKKYGIIAVKFKEPKSMAIYRCIGTKKSAT